MKLYSKIRKSIKLFIIISAVLLGISGIIPKEGDFDSAEKAIEEIKTLEETGEITNEPIKESVSDIGTLTVSYIDVGQADCILLTQGDSQMMIDCGNREDNEIILEYLQEKNVSQLDYLILTHPHEDHIGSAPDIIEYVNGRIGTVLMPEVVAETKIFEETVDTLLSYNLTAVMPDTGSHFSFGNASFEILSPVTVDTENLNDTSIGIRLTFGNNSFVMCGDAEESEYDMLSFDVSADVLKTGHHGSSTSTNDEFLDAVNPKYVIISCGEDNSYGHPHIETLQKIKEKNIQMFRTDKQGTITAISDGNNITFNTTPCTDYTPGTYKE